MIFKIQLCSWSIFYKLISSNAQLTAYLRKAWFFKAPNEVSHSSWRHPLPCGCSYLSQPSSSLSTTAFQNTGMYKISVTWPTGWIRELQNSSFWQYPHIGIDLLLVELCFTLPIANVRAGADFLRDSQLWGLILPFFSLWELTLSDVVSNNVLVVEPYKISNIWLKKNYTNRIPWGKRGLTDINVI